jgi:hypothetical protein
MDSSRGHGVQGLLRCTQNMSLNDLHALGLQRADLGALGAVLDEPVDVVRPHPKKARGRSQYLRAA